MKIDGKKQRVDVLDKECAGRRCFRFGYDKGSYTPGVGYTNYHTKPKPVCLTRHVDGCPLISICPRCKTCSVHPAGMKCGWCKEGVTIPYEAAP
jgi:hypothetical protein